MPSKSNQTRGDATRGRAIHGYALQIKPVARLIGAGLGKATQGYSTLSKSNPNPRFRGT